MRVSLDVLFENRDVLVVAKPAGLLSIPDQTGAESLLDRAAAHLGRSAASVHPTSRLDRGVSGVVTFAHSARGRAALASARASGSYRRHYVAIGASSSLPPSGSWTANIGRASDPRHRKIDGRDATPAWTEFRVVDQVEGYAVLHVNPITGRTHQIRLHASDAGAPLLGDRVYGGPSRLVDRRGRVLALSRIALHAFCVEVKHPDVTFAAIATIPEEFVQMWAFVGGEASVLGKFTHEGAYGSHSSR